jgi:hypothetical protein
MSPAMSNMPIGERRIRYFLLKGRLHPPYAPSVPTFADALAEANSDDLAWALSILVKQSDKKRPFQQDRKKAIADKMHRILCDVMGWT